MGKLWTGCAVAFVAGGVYEAGCVWFVRFATHGDAWPAAAVSILVCAAQVAGILETVKGKSQACAFVLGHGAGTFLAIRLAAAG